MFSKREVNLGCTAALVPMFGEVDKKPRPLDREVITIGRARGCDIGLDAPEISTLHCVLYWTVSGFKVRDCGSRSGTRVNGTVPRHQPLADGDLLQIGPFTFKFSMPATLAGDSRKMAALWLEHCQRSRRNLARLALTMRKKLHARY